MVPNSVRRAARLVALVLIAGCSSIDVTDPGPTFIELTADRTSAIPGQDVDFTFNAGGSSMNAIRIDYGDGESEQVDTFGATTASGRRTHAYAEAGSYTVTATVEDAITGSVSDDVTIQVTSP